MSDQKVVLVTGASSGVGQSTAQLLSQRGYRVFGTSRNPASAVTIPNVEMLALDVRTDASVEACVNIITRQTQQIDVLVNNAGYELAGALEELSIEEAKAQFETNFFGVVRMVKAVLPHMRHRQGGQIINISSLGGLTPIPFMGIYSASKFALEGYTEALHLEVMSFNIHVSQIEAGFLNSPMIAHRQMAAHQLEVYDAGQQRALTAVRNDEAKGPGPELVAGTVLKIITSRSPRLRYVIGRQAKLVSRLRQFLPEGVYQQAVRRNFGLDSDT
jgi:NAD(P)-dependent dehydrogenase (short-subunit alcohol dehydrogenase family)